MLTRNSDSDSVKAQANLKALLCPRSSTAPVGTHRNNLTRDDS